MSTKKVPENPRPYAVRVDERTENGWRTSVTVNEQSKKAAADLFDVMLHAVSIEEPNRYTPHGDRRLVLLGKDRTPLPQFSAGTGWYPVGAR